MPPIRAENFPIDLSAFRALAVDPAQGELTRDQLIQLQANVQLCRDVIVFFTAVADARGLGGHTGGPYDIVPEVLIADAFMRGSQKVLPIFWDEAGHRVAIQYLMSALHGELPAEHLLHYREAGWRLPGHPERDFTAGVKFSSGRLGHLWAMVNGVAAANPGRAVFLFGSDGSQQEGDDAEAARLAVAQRYPVKLVIDDNDVTIAGHPSAYLPGFDVGKTLAGHGLPVDTGDGEDLAVLFRRMARAVLTPGPVALINKRKMAPGIPDLEGSHHAHDVVKVATAVKYLEARGHAAAVAYLKAIPKATRSVTHLGSGGEVARNRDLFGKIVAELLAPMPAEQRQARVRVYDCDLEGSCGLKHIKDKCPDIYVNAGIMERGNFSAAAGFGFDHGKQGIFGTFSAFLEMCVSEITMARLNECNVLAHFSHAGVDDMADNTCHFGINNFYADGGIQESLHGSDTTRLYFPADAHQLKALLHRVFWEPGLRFIFTTRSGVPAIFNEQGKPLFGEGYQFTPGRDEVVRAASARGAWIVSYGETLYRALDAVERLRQAGHDVGLINKPTLNVPDEEMLRRIGQGRAVLVVESQNAKTGLGSRMGTWLLERGLSPRFARLGTQRLGCGGLWEQMVHQDLDSAGITARMQTLLA